MTNVDNQSDIAALRATSQPSILASLRSLVPERAATFLEALRIAEQQAQRLLHRFDVPFGSTSEDLLLRLPRIAIEYIHSMPTSGCSFWDLERKSWIIQINADEPETRQRFTMFHEYKHIVDHGRTDNLYGTGADASLRAEQTADFFAGCVLMPRPAMKRAWGDGNQTAAQLAAVFDVSVVAAGVRIAQVGLADGVEPARRSSITRNPGRSRRYQRQFSNRVFVPQEAS